MEMNKVGLPPIESKVVDKLLDLLSTDDAFRTLFMSNASAALEQIGYVQPEDSDLHAGLCLVVSNLASKEDIIRDRTKLEKSLNSVVNFFVPKELQAY
ncbi:putative modified peptide [Luteimonas cucumeris]|uniref:Putative modified peptide n=1 Tax=Luteimonas cucumeris TaxID=985012 RepID=A0A562LDQ7_9GAMM|nr:NHLP-related RiPP peptide [Luteimonas cucumeris]TWI05819.1 putative modified peptide [Luteimonas cucumeris]